MNPSRDDATDALLRRQFDGPVTDEGFSQRLMHRLPRRGRRAAWPLWFDILAGAVACWLALLSSPLPLAGWRDWMSGEWSTPVVIMLLATLGMAMLALAWGVAEADDH